MILLFLCYFSPNITEKQAFVGLRFGERGVSGVVFDRAVSSDTLLELFRVDKGRLGVIGPKRMGGGGSASH